MSQSTTALRRQIASAVDLQSVVRTMKALAASSIEQYERSVLALGDYYHTVELGLGACLRQRGYAAPDAQRRSAVGVIGAVVFGSDQGLVGQFNEMVVDLAIEVLGTRARGVQLWSVGERAQALLADAGLTPGPYLPVPSSIQAVTPLVGQLLMQGEALHSQGRIDELHLFYNRPSAGAGYAPVHQRLLPLDEGWLQGRIDVAWPTHHVPEVLGGSDASLHLLTHEFLFISMFRACTESLASENASRLAAMQRADRNIDELLERLQVESHRVRQGGIDEELFDVISGFEALTERTPPGKRG